VDFGALLRKAWPWLLKLDASSGEEGNQRTGCTERDNGELPCPRAG
jgi:hypothetical protein